MARLCAPAIPAVPAAGIPAVLRVHLDSRHHSPVARYVRRVATVGHSLGPTEERGFALWVGYDVEGVDDPDAFGLTDVTDWSDERLRAIGVTAFRRVTVEELRRWTS